MRPPVFVERFGRLGYAESCALQERRAEACASGGPEALLLLEHEPVITLGRGADPANVSASAETLRHAGIALEQSTRGGDVTYHGPGQLIAYPVLNLTRRRMGALDYVEALEETVLRVIAEYDLTGSREAINRGVWVGGRKIAAIGVRVARGVTRHGLALNVSTELEAFRHIVPCGLRDRGVTSIERELGAAPPMGAVRAAFERAFAAVFDSELQEHA